MKKKFLTVLLAIIAALSLCFGLAACGGTPKDPAGDAQTEQGSTDGSEDNGGNQDGDKEIEGDEDETPDEGGSEEEGGDKQPDEGGGQGGSEGTGGNTPDEGGEGSGGDKNPDEGDQGGSEGTGGEQGGQGEQGGDDDEPCAHRYTAENVCSLCGDEWKYTEGLTYELDKTTDTYAVERYQNVSGDVVIPYGYQGKFVTKIGNDAFECDEITALTIPGSMQTIEPGAFVLLDGNAIEHIAVAEDNPNYKSENECLIQKETNTLILGCKNSVIPNDITAIGDGAFLGCSALTDINIPDSVTTIGYVAFEGTAYFDDPSHWDSDGVLYIDGHLIRAKSTLAGAYTVRAGTKTIAARAFSEISERPEICLDLTGIVIPDSVTSIGDMVFDRVRDTTAKSKILSKQPLSRA